MNKATLYESPKIAWVAQIDRHQTFKPVMVSIVGLYLTVGEFIFAETF